MTNQNNNERKSNVGFQSESQCEDDVSNSHKCGNCGWTVSSTADICENCSDWQLKNKCCFCYTDIESGQKFCAECGNPPEGIICFSCGKLSHFDFCPNCNVSLTEQASETIQIIGDSIEFIKILKINDDGNLNGIINIKQQSNDKGGNDSLANYLSKFSDQKTKKKQSFTLTDNPDNNVEENIKSVEQSRKNIQIDEQKKIDQQLKENEASKYLEDLRSKTFSTNQEARKYFGALKILLPQIIKKKIPHGWKCNAYDSLHDGGPQECADPSSGGTWIYEIVTETTFKQIEI